MKTIETAALSHSIASGNFGWTHANETALVSEVSRIAVLNGRSGSDFRARQFRANVGRNIRRRALRVAQSEANKQSR